MTLENLATSAYFPLSPTGYIRNPCCPTLTHNQYAEHVFRLIDILRYELHDEISSVFVRGSIARGVAVPGLSDLDIIVVLKSKKTSSLWSHIGSACAKDLRRNSELTLDLKIVAISNLSRIDDDYLCFLLATQSVCVLGSRLCQKKRWRPEDAIFYVKRFGRNILSTTGSPSSLEKKDRLRWLAKVLVRTGFDLTIRTNRRYTRDLPLCFHDFSQLYPSKSLEMGRVLSIYLNTSPIPYLESARTIAAMASWLWLEANKTHSDLLDNQITTRIMVEAALAGLVERR